MSIDFCFLFRETKIPFKKNEEAQQVFTEKIYLKSSKDTTLNHTS